MAELMCGFAGFITSKGTPECELRAGIERMIARLIHRGPDDSGVWVDGPAGVSLGFRRLAIIDISAHGHQPMHSASGRFKTVFNGEIYNYAELRHELECAGFKFRGHSDTEVMLAAFERWGIEGAVERFIGMFAIAVWDSARRTLHLVRDRLGIKPLYVYSEPGYVAFGSELTALVAGPSFNRSLDLDAVAAYLRYLYVPAPRSIYRGARKLRPGHILTIPEARAQLPASRAYWTAEDAAKRGSAEPYLRSDAEAVDALDDLLADAVRLRMRSDVPLGALFSGGIDSSAVVSLMQTTADRPVKTFTVGFAEAEYNEAPHAARIARHLGTDHTEVQLSADDALALVPRVPEVFDEPFADPSQLPTYLVSRVARRDVTVALSGDGGDEVFAGYHRYLQGERLLERILHVPRPARRALATAIGALSLSDWDRVHKVMAPVLPTSLRLRLAGDKLYKVRDLLAADSTPLMYQSLLSAWQRPESLVDGGNDSQDDVHRILSARTPESLLSRMQLADQSTYLVDDLLAKVDRASMAVSLEVRVPILDHRVVEFSWKLPRHLKVRNGRGKWLLRQVLYRRVPRTLVDREKMGFSVPVDCWLRGALREWAEDLSTSTGSDLDGALDRSQVISTWREFQAGRNRAGLALWAITMLQAWLAHRHT